MANCSATSPWTRPRTINPSPECPDGLPCIGSSVHDVSRHHRAEREGFEPSDLLTASHILGVREGSLSATTGALPGIIVQHRSDRFSGIRPRCLHNCLHFSGPAFPRPLSNRVHRRRSLRGSAGSLQERGRPLWTSGVRAGIISALFGEGGEVSWIHGSETGDDRRGVG